MSAVTIAFVSFLLVAFVTFMVGVMLTRLWPAIRKERFAAATPELGSASILRWDQDSPGWRQTLERFGRSILRRDALAFSRYRERLVKAGFHDPRAVGVFLGAKVALLVGASLAYTLYGLWLQRLLPNVLLVSVICGGLGFFLPDFWLRLRRRTRERQILNAMPDMLDLLLVCVEAGMGFDAAVARVAEQPENQGSPLHQELLRMHLEMRAGRPREEALRALATRTGTEEVKAMVAAFIQTDRLGTPLGKTLRVQSDTARVQRRHRAETRAQLAPLMMLFPTILFLMPSFMLVAMAPSLLRIFEILRSIGK